MKVQLSITALLLTLLPGAVTAQVTTIYSDLFSGGATALNGATTTTGGGTWVASAIANQDGSLIGNTTGGGAVLPVSLAVGNIYTLSMDIALTGTAASTKYIHFGFVDQSTLATPGGNNASDRFNNLTMTGYPTIALVTVGGVIQGTELYNSVVGSTTTLSIGSTHNYKIVLDTTGDGSSFKASYYFDNISFFDDAVMDYAALSTIGGVGFSGRTITGTIDNFLLTVEPVPEPSALALICLGFGGLVCTRHLRRK